MLKGYSLPLSPRGIANLAPAPPWHDAGTVLAIEYWTDPVAAAAVLPPGLDPSVDPGRCVAHFVEWQFATDDGAEPLDPVRGQYAEFILLVAATFRGEAVMTCPAIFVDQDVSLLRGLIQGWPKCLGSIRATRAYDLPGSAANPALGPGATFGATLAAEDRRLAEATVTLERIGDRAPGLGATPVLNVRHFPELAAGRHHRPAVHELVRLRAHGWTTSAVWEGSATLRYFPSPTQELHDLAPLRVGRGYRFDCALSVADLAPITDLRAPVPIAVSSGTQPITPPSPNAA